VAHRASDVESGYMTLEERVEIHFASYQATFTLQMGMLMNALARMTTESDERHRKLQEEHLKFEQGLKELRELVERYIRYRGNGNAPAN
jgi:hypothetical protein